MKKRYVFLIVVTLLIGLPLLRFWGMKQEMQYTARSKYYNNIVDRSAYVMFYSFKARN